MSWNVKENCWNCGGDWLCLTYQCVPVYSTIYLSFSKTSLSPLDVYSHHKKPIVQIEPALQMQYHCFKLDCFILFLCEQVFPKLSKLYKKDCDHVYFTHGSLKKEKILFIHRPMESQKTFCSLYTVLQSVYCTISKLLNKYKIYILYNFLKKWYNLVDL